MHRKLTTVESRCNNCRFNEIFCLMNIIWIIKKHSINLFHHEKIQFNEVFSMANLINAPQRFVVMRFYFVKHNFVKHKIDIKEIKTVLETFCKKKKKKFIFLQEMKFQIYLDLDLPRG